MTSQRLEDAANRDWMEAQARAVLRPKHTPGPWETDKVAVRSSGPDGRQICLCEISARGRPYDETYDELIANARLIAASPDLLAVLTELERTSSVVQLWIDNWDPPFVQDDEWAADYVAIRDALKAARAAIAKAKGDA